MARRPAPADDAEDDEIDFREAMDEDARPPSRYRRPAARRPAAREWRPSTEEGADEELQLSDGPRRRRFRLPDSDAERRPVYWRARDSLYFEPLVAVAIIVLVLVSLYAYTQNWPPMYVVESESMQHGSNDVLGVINTGDLVLAQKIPTSDIVPYVVGMGRGYSTYDEYGDVLLYYPNGATAHTPIIHRALVYIVWNAADRGYDIPELAGLPCGGAADRLYSTPGTPMDCGTTGLTNALDLYGIGWQSVEVTLSLNPSILGDHSGFVTMGDNNFCPTQTNCPDPPVMGNPDQGVEFQLSQLVEPSWIVGVARGMVPWFGAVKLLLEGSASEVPSQSWQFMGLTIAGAILAAFGIHYALRAEGIEDERRKMEEAEEREARAESEGEEDRPSFWSRLRRTRNPEDDETDGTGRAAASSATRSHTRSRNARGRPKPTVKRSRSAKSTGHSAKRERGDAEDDL